MKFSRNPCRLYNGVFRTDRPCPANILRLDNGCLPMVLSMNRTGILADAAHFQRLGKDLEARYEAVRDEIESLAGWRVNPSSGDQVARLLFDELKLASGTGRRTDTGARLSTDDDTLSSLLDAHPVVRLICDGREAAKIKGTYCDPLPGFAGRDGRVRTTLKMYTARTGRLASENPNLQNIPVRSEEGRRVRDGFIARDGCLLSSLDLSQIEMVWAAELSRDRVMMEVYGQGQDLHVRTACALFGEEYGEAAPLWAAYKRGELAGDPAALARMRDFEINKRLPAKTLGFAVLYGVTPDGLRIQILSAGGPPLTADQCAAYIEGWFELFGGVREWMEAQYSRAQRFGMTWTAFGRARELPEIRSALRGMRNRGLRQAGNTPVQGTAGDHLKLAMAEIWDGPVRFYRELGEVCDPVLQVHDELIFELGEGIAEEFNHWASAIMCGAVRPMEVRVKSSASLARTWGGLK